jgi:hypothetical protein
MILVNAGPSVFPAPAGGSNAASRARKPDDGAIATSANRLFAAGDRASAQHDQQNVLQPAEVGL